MTDEARVTQPTHVHEWIDARNMVIRSGEGCRCGATRSADGTVWVVQRESPTRADFEVLASLVNRDIEGQFEEATGRTLDSALRANRPPEPPTLDVERVHRITCKRLVEHTPGSGPPDSFLWPCTEFVREYAALGASPPPPDLPRWVLDDIRERDAQTEALADVNPRALPLGQTGSKYDHARRQRSTYHLDSQEIAMGDRHLLLEALRGRALNWPEPPRNDAMQAASQPPSTPREP